VGLLNVAGYYDHLLAFLDHMVSQRFVQPAHRDLLQVGSDVPELLDRLVAYQPVQVDKWLDQ
jgi:predicted Rossmann-fold nucleotide-binding protein